VHRAVVSKYETQSVIVNITVWMPLGGLLLSISSSFLYIRSVTICNAIHHTASVVGKQKYRMHVFVLQVRATGDAAFSLSRCVQPSIALLVVDASATPRQVRACSHPLAFDLSSFMWTYTTAS
jgi:hypothetical protein